MALNLKSLTPICLTLLLSVLSLASPPAERLNYSLPPIIQKEKKLIYGKDTADLYLSFNPIFPVSEVRVTLHSSHSGLQIQSQKNRVSSTTYSIILRPGNPYKLRHRVYKTSPFSLASLTITLDFDFPHNSLEKWILQRSATLYRSPVARAKLLEKLRKISNPHREVLGVFVYGKQFLNL
jgi:hypothetical protein